jgi:hypothetical protein
VDEEIGMFQSKAKADNVGDKSGKDKFLEAEKIVDGEKDVRILI